MNRYDGIFKRILSPMRHIITVTDNGQCMRLKFCGIVVYKVKNPLIMEYYKKRHVLETKPNLSTIILGSSHGNRGVNTTLMEEPTVNLATTSQDLYQGYHLLKYAVQRRPTIKKVVLCFAPFSHGYNISYSSEKYRTAMLQTVFDIKPFQHDSTISKRWYNQVPKRFLQNISPDSDNNPLQDTQPLDSVKVRERATKHVEFATNNSMDVWLQKIIDFTREHSIELHLVIPPYTDMYKQYFNSTTFDAVYEMCKKCGVEYHSFLDDTDFVPDDFHDSDHLNISGATKFTAKINTILGR